MVWQNAEHGTSKAHRPTQVYGAYSETDLATVFPRNVASGYHYGDDDFRFYNAGTCPECGSGMIRSGACFSCPTCGFGSCSG